MVGDAETIEHFDWKLRLVRMIGRSHWLRLGIRRRIVKAFYPPESTAARNFLVDFRGLKYRGSLASFIDWHVFFFGGYELAELDLIQDLTSAIDACTAFDVGANVGHHALVIAVKSAAVHAFEPMPALRQLALDQLLLNGMDRVKVYPFGLGAETASIPYHFNSESRNRGTGSFVAGHDPNSDSQQILDIVCGDDWVGNAGIEVVDFVKIDVEGFEADVLAGLYETLKRCEPFVLVEITLSSAEGFEKRGGLAAMIPFEAQLFRVANPRQSMGIFNSGRYRLVPIDSAPPENHSYNVLVVPQSRRTVLERLKGGGGSTSRSVRPVYQA